MLSVVAMGCVILGDADRQEVAEMVNVTMEDHAENRDPHREATDDGVAGSCCACRDSPFLFQNLGLCRVLRAAVAVASSLVASFPRHVPFVSCPPHDV